MDLGVEANPLILPFQRPSISDTDESFTARIERLVRENNQQREELDRLQHKVTEVTDISEGWKMRCTQLGKDLLWEQGIVCSLEEAWYSTRFQLLHSSHDCIKDHAVV
ncbi:hypothetical protein An04g07860 [Aspergillus niger]|uniref:Uncharacterized protein n=2 Tax=Aspergillus niger TaxID=5061 RepID=A2QJQ2_ASPNC|nr:hypothetical protein An04g07860 [Aspergillus niger]CAK44767.1 hypothetical protein An04g07860 [Aspergillus niger]